MGVTNCVGHIFLSIKHYGINDGWKSFAVQGVVDSILVRGKYGGGARGRYACVDITGMLEISARTVLFGVVN